MCKSDVNIDDLHELRKTPDFNCRLGDFSSGWDPYTAGHLYTKGPSPGEQTGEQVKKRVGVLLLCTLDFSESHSVSNTCRCDSQTSMPPQNHSLDAIGSRSTRTSPSRMIPGALG